MLHKSVPVIYSHTGLRGLAAMTVFLAHLKSWGFAGAFNDILYKDLFFWHNYAVDLFFILSGFILYWVYLSSGQRVNWPSFFKARIGRILPLYYVTLIAVFPLDLYSFFRHGYSYVGTSYWINLPANLTLMAGVLGRGGMNVPSWSISVEFVCYVAIFPLLVWLDRGLRMKNFSLLLASVMIVIVTRLFIACYIHHAWLGERNLRVDGFPLARGILGFFLGFFICFIYRKLAAFGIAKGWIDSGLVVSIIIFGMTRTGVLPEYDVIGIFPVVVFLTAFDCGFAAGLLKHRGLQWLGERSYSIYMWHWPLCFLLMTIFESHFFTRFGIFTHPILALPAFLLIVSGVLWLSDLSYRYLEDPCREAIRRFRSDARLRSSLPTVRGLEHFPVNLSHNGRDERSCGSDRA